MIDQQGNNLIFIVSAPRSGSTLLGALLGNHSRAFCPPETWLLLQLHAIHSNETIIVSHYDNDLARKSFSHIDKHILNQSSKSFALSFYNSHLEKEKKDIFIDKTPRYYQILPFIDMLFPLSYKIWIKRNPLDVIASYKITWGYSLKEILGLEGIVSPSSFDATISHYLLDSFFSEDNSEERLLVAYENLVQNPLQALEIVCQNIDIPFEETMIHYGANNLLMQMHTDARMGDKNLLQYTRPHKHSIGRWRHALTPEEVRQILQTLGKAVFLRLGYGHEFEAATEFAGMSVDDVDETGRLDRLFDQYASYIDRGLLRLGSIQHTMIARQNTQLEARMAECEADRAARLAVIERQGEEVSELQAQVHHWLQENAALAQAHAVSEADRAARLEVMQRQGEEIARLQADVHRRLEENKELGQQVEALETERGALIAQLQTAQGVVEIVRRTRVYRLLRRLRRWRFVEQGVFQRPITSTLRSHPTAAEVAMPRISASAPLAHSHSEHGDLLSPLQEAQDCQQLEFEACYAQVREPKKRGSVDYLPGAEDRIVQRLRLFGIAVYDYKIDITDYHQYFSAARYLEDFPNYYPFNLPEKSLEHYIAAKLLQLGKHDIYIDTASENSPVPEIYRRIFGVKAYRQDITYQPGLNGDKIGGDAANMPVPDAFATKMALHCSFEHFERDADICFIHEAARVLRPGGIICIVPLYLSEEYAIQTDPVVAFSAGIVFEDDAIVYCAQGWNNHHGRFYDPEHLLIRVCEHLNGLKLEIYKLTNTKQVDESCYARFAMLIKKSETC